LILQLANGDLLDYINEKGILSEEESAIIFLQLIQTLKWTHAKGFVHRDLKPENILLLGDQLLLADWAHSGRINVEEKDGVSFGTEGYASPELVTRQPSVGPAVDFWSLGIILYSMLCGRLPFDKSPRPSESCVLEIPNYLSIEVETLLAGLLVPTPENRWTIKEIEECAWVRYWAAQKDQQNREKRGSKEKVKERRRKERRSSIERLRDFFARLKTRS